MAEELEAGRELDAMIAERVFGEPYPAPIEEYPWWSSAPVYSPKRQWIASATIGGGENAHIWSPRRYSTEIAAAWSVVERVDNRNSVVKDLGVHTFGLARYDDGTYAAMFFNASARANSAPLAICRAALRATPPCEAPLVNSNVPVVPTDENEEKTA